MALHNTGYLVIDDGDGRQGVFELRNIEPSNGELTKTYIMGDRGQYVSEINRLLDDATGFSVGDGDAKRRTGRWLDGGAGNWQETITFSVGVGDDVTWGDGSGGDGPENVTRFDASGVDVKPVTREQILKNWIAQTISDSRGYTRLHWGEYTDGRFDEERGGEYVSVEAGVFEQPMVVAIEQFSHSKDEVSSFEGIITMNRAGTFPNVVEGVSQWITDNVAGEDPDYLDGGA